ncbi:MAG TPA: hypothetical protein DEP18_08100 [Flavobacteriales bacterium]|nr:hypothetical protein [Flavobacteriales bacterium]
MRSKVVFLLILWGGMFGSCRKDCSSDNPTCKDAPPEGQACQAAFQRWFYNKKSDRCEEIGYNGCDALGFSTREDCEQCKCK